MEKFFYFLYQIFKVAVMIGSNLFKLFSKMADCEKFMRLDQKFIHFFYGNKMLTINFE